MYDQGVDPVTVQAHAMFVRALFAMTLLSLAVSAEAREARMAGPGGDGSNCAPDYAIGAEPDVDPVRTTRRIEPDKPVSPRGGDSEVSRPPRWHSFLPGMFR
jgi:hypothetical protein